MYRRAPRESSWPRATRARTSWQTSWRSQTALPTTATPARPRDFTLTIGDAARLRRGGWRRILGFFGSARDSISRPARDRASRRSGSPGSWSRPLPSMYGAGRRSSASCRPSGPPSSRPHRLAAEVARVGIALSMGARARIEPDRRRVVFAGGNPDEAAAPRVAATSPATAACSRSATMRRACRRLFVVAGTLLIAGLGLFALRWSARGSSDADDPGPPAAVGRAQPRRVHSATRWNA